MEMPAQSARTSPYLMIWVRPRATIRRIVDQDPRQKVIALVVIAAALNGLAHALAALRCPIMSTDLGVIRLFPVARLMLPPIIVFQTLAALILLYVNGWLLRWVGGLLGGVAKAVEVRAALGWAQVPVIASGIINVAATPYGVGMYHTIVRTAFLNPASVGLPTVMATVFFAAVLWEFIVGVGCIAEVHRFSSLRGLAAVVIGRLILIAGFAAMAMSSGAGAIAMHYFASNP